MDGRVTLRDDKQTFEQAKDWWMKERVCMYCGETFTMLSSFGKWECKIHYGRKSLKPDGEYIGTKRNKRLRYPNGKLTMDCCNQVITPGSRLRPGLESIMIQQRSRPVKTYSRRSITIWTGDRCQQKIMKHTMRAKAFTEGFPPPCTMCDHRDLESKWEIPRATVSGEGDEAKHNFRSCSSVANIQDFAPILALMNNVENRPAFQCIDEKGNVSRINKVIPGKMEVKKDEITGEEIKKFVPEKVPEDIRMEGDLWYKDG